MKHNVRRSIALSMALAVVGGTTVFATNVLTVLQGSIKIDNATVDAEFTATANEKISLGYGLGLEKAHTYAFTTNSSGEVIIPSIITDNGITYDVTGILQGALKGCGDATTITLSEGITTISEGAFDGCTSVTKINLPNTLTYLRGHNPFAECTALTAIVFNGTEAEWNAKGFSSSYGSATINFSDSGSTDEAPEGWDENTWIDVDGIDAKIRMNPDTGAIVEVASSVTIAEIPEKIYDKEVKSISGTAFKDCASLEIVSIPNGVTEIANYTFMNGYLTSQNSDEKTYYYGGKSLKQVGLPNTLTKIGNAAFYGATVDTIYIPKSVTTVGSQALQSQYMKNIFFGGTEVEWASVGGSEGSYSTIFTTLQWVDSTEIKPTLSGVIGGNITFNVETGMVVDADSTITSIVLPEYIAGTKVIGISDTALSNCTSLEYIALPENIIQLTTTVFDNCSAMKSIVYYGSETQWIEQGLSTSYNSINVAFLADFDESAWRDVDGIDAQVRISKTGTILEVEDTVTIAEIPEVIDGVMITAIDALAFKDCASLEFLSIPSGVTKIEALTFSYATSNDISYYGGKSLKQVCLPDTLTKIGNYAFYNSVIETIYIFDSVTSIGSQALKSSSTSDVFFAGTEDDWNTAINGETVLDSSTKLTYKCGTKISLSVSGIVGGNIIFDVETGMITGADNSITMAIIPEYIAGYKVVGIDANAFASCTDLRVVNLYNYIQSINSNAFPNTGINIYFYGTQGEWNSIEYTPLSNHNLVIGKKDFVLDKDSNGYMHSSSLRGFGTGIDDYNPQLANVDGTINGDYDDLATAFSTRLAEFSESYTKDYFEAEFAEEWGGSCFGVASTIGLVFADYTTLDELSSTKLTDEQDTYYELPIPVNNTQLYNTVMYYQVGQGLISGNILFMGTNIANAKPLLDALDKGQAVIFSYGYSAGGHAILALDYEQKPDGSFIVKLFDENSYKGSTGTAKYIDLTISADYTTYSFKPDTGPSNSFDDGSVEKDILTNDPALKGTTGYTEASYLRFLTLDDVYKIGPVYDSNGDFITGTSTKSMGYTEDIAADTADTMLINIPMNSDITITIDDQTISYKNGLFSGDMTDIEANPVEKGSASEWLLTVPNSDIIYAENNAPEEKDMNVEVFSNKGTLSVKADGIQKAILDLNEGIEVMLADGVNSTEMKNYFKIDDELVSVESIITDDTKLFVDDLTQSINVVSIGDAEISTIKNTLTGVSNHLADNFDITIDSNELKDFFSGWKGN